MRSSLKVFRRGLRRDARGWEVAGRVDKTRKEEAATFLEQAMGKVFGGEADAVYGRKPG
jgi:hypothetical protein